MAKIRRVVRRVTSPEGAYFDEQLWPIYIALVVLGCFSIGVSIAYLKFSGVPWYASAWTSLIGIVLVVAGFMVAFRLVDNRWIRRSMQLSMVLCAILHVGLIVQLIETRISVARLVGSTSEVGVLERRPPKIAYEYHASQLLPETDRPLQDFERPVPTQTPEPAQSPVDVPRQAQSEEQPRAPAQPQPVPVPENVPTAEPNVVRQNRPNEAAPRQAQQPSLLSRQLKASDLATSQPIEVPTAAAQPNAAQQPSPAAAVARAPAGSASVPRLPQEPTTTSPAETTQVARHTPTTGPAEVSATPTLPRRSGQPAATPRTQIATGDAPSVARATAAGQLAPANTTATGRITASPATERNPAATALEIATDTSARPQRRDHPAEAQPGEVAQTPSPIANRQPRATLRTDVATSAAIAGPEGAAGNSNSQQDIAPRASQLQRLAQVTAVQPSVQPASAPRTSDAARPSLQMTRAAGREGPTATANPSAAPTLTRQSGAPSLPGASRTAQVAVGAFVGTSGGGEVSPTSTATRRQATTSPQAGPRVGAPGTAQVASLATEAAAASGPIRRAAGGASSGDSPVVGPGGGGVPANSRSRTATAANVVTTVGDVPANAGPGAGGSGALGPSATAVARQGAGSSGASGAAALAAGEASGGLGGGEGSARSRVSLTGGGPGRAQYSGPPSIDPTGTATAAPRRAAAIGDVASSPALAESPADAGSPTGTTGGAGAGGASEGAGSGIGAGFAQPSRLALSRGTGGIAGGGRSPNLGGSLPGGGGPALVASGSARRAEASQAGPAGDALTPSRPSSIARARAGGDLPTSTIKADDVEFGAIGGTGQVADLTASAGAALTRGDSNATPGAVTAAKGTGDVDLGPTQLVAEPGVGRGAGGGQPDLSFGRPDLRLARSSGGGGQGDTPLMALASTKVGEVAAPEGAGGGTGGGNGPGGAVGMPGPSAVNLVRAGGGPAGSGGGTGSAGERGPDGGGTASLLAETNLSRADASDGGGGEGAAGTPGFADEEEKQRRLARSATGGGPALAIGGAIAADLPASPAGAGGDGGFPGAAAGASPSAVAVARGSQSGGAAAGGAPLAAGEPGAAGGSGSGAGGAGAAGAGSGGGAAVGSLTIARAEATDGAAGPAVIGRGTGRPARAASGATFAASTTADTVSIAGAAASGGKPEGAPLEAQGLQASRLAGGALGPLRSGALGAGAGAEVVDAAGVGPPGDGVGRRQSSPSSIDGPAIDGLVNRGAPGRLAAEVRLSGGATNVADIPQVGPNSPVAQAEFDHGLPGAGQTPMARQAGVGLTVSIDAPDGPGGLGGDYTPEVGLNSRLASSDSMQVQIRASRFVKKNLAGGLPSVSSGAIVASDAFIGRGSRDPGADRGAGRSAPDLPSDNAIELGLAFLARYQLPDGGWSLQGFPEGAQLQTDTAATALAVIAFQGAGYNHREFRYRDVVRGGLDFLVQSQKENGDLFVPLDDQSNRSVWLYSHSLAAIALCEAYGMTQDPALREPAQKAIDFIVAGQHESRGGWRYSPGVGSDTSVTGWMMMALKSGQLAGLDVPTGAYAKIGRWLDAAQQSPAEPHLYRYNPEAPNTPEQRHGRVASKTMTSVGLLMRLYTGWKRDNPNMIRGADFLAQHPPALGTARDPQRDTYYWYYATQVMAHMGGERWQAWNDRLHPLLVNSQVRQGPYAGSWDPQAPLPDRWGPHAGRLYVTAMNLLSLEVQYRKLPLYEDTAK